MKTPDLQAHIAKLEAAHDVRASDILEDLVVSGVVRRTDVDAAAESAAIRARVRQAPDQAPYPY